MADAADEGRDARGRATQGAVAEQWVTVATRLTEVRVSELALVLTARGVPFQRQPDPRGGWELWVPLAMAPVAATELTLYKHENARQIGSRPLDEVGAGKAGVAWYVATLLAVFFALHTDLFNRDWLAAGRLEAGPLLNGEWWRAVTALTLHIELDHLGGNLAFGAFFGYFVGRYLGHGVGWLAVLLAASGANVLNAWVQSPLHRSIGASTAVFAALGLLVAYTWRRGFLRDTPWRARIAPIVAGLGLLAFTGTAGENTDLGAHMFGFIAGFAAGGLLGGFAPTAWLKSKRVQRVCGAVAALMLIAAWAVGLRTAG
ncbi:MAG TPA: rhomboid family intramembrane serine protease [Gammaproteobacteria bacterium]|nr:rhomboid family intramembrane serine protease [Gammaproteobacteria bacterium]